MWYTVSIVQKTADDGHVDEYHVVTRTEFTDNVTWTAYVKVTKDSDAMLGVEQHTDVPDTHQLRRQTFDKRRQIVYRAV